MDIEKILQQMTLEEKQTSAPVRISGIHSRWSSSVCLP